MRIPADRCRTIANMTLTAPRRLRARTTRDAVDAAGARAMNAAVRDVQQSKQQFVVFLGLFARSAAPARLAAIVFAIAAFFAAAPHLNADTAVTVAKFVTPAGMRAGSLLLKSEDERHRASAERRYSSPLPGEVRGGA